MVYTTQENKEQQFIFKRKELRNKHGPVINETTLEYKEKENTNLETLYKKPNIEYFLNYKFIAIDGRVWRSEEKYFEMHCSTNQPVKNG